MRIDISPRVADDRDAHRWLDRILHKIEDGWHVWETPDQLDPSEIESTSWVHDRGSQGQWVQELLVASIQRSAWSIAPHGRSLRVRPVPSAVDELNPEDACRLAEEPLCILVENRVSDGAFVKRIVNELDHPLDSIWNRPGDPIRLDSVGGKGQMYQEVKRRTEGRQCRPRLVVVIDSDRVEPSDTPGKDASRLRRVCDRDRLPCWILAKREADNYLPRTLLIAKPDTGAEHRQRVEAWDRLNDDQKDFFDMKEGLSKAAADSQLFARLSVADLATLHNGFGLTVHVCWTAAAGSVKSELSARGRGDLEYGLDLIRSET